jgi:hypothetical protein
VIREPFQSPKITLMPSSEGLDEPAITQRNFLASAFKGRWRIEAMDLWDKDAIDLIEPGFIAFDGEEGEMRFIAVHAWLDVRYDIRDKVPVAEFSWEGVDEGDQRSGRGWAVLNSDGKLTGHIFFHNGDDSAFTCDPR